MRAFVGWVFLPAAALLVGLGLIDRLRGDGRLFGAMIGGEPLEPGAYSVTAHLLGWLYHFSNGMTFGIMDLALIGDGARRHWLWAVLLAGGLEVGCF